MHSLAQRLDQEGTKKYKQAFFLALLTAAVIFLPYVIMDGGYFTFYGDFNVQQIPFYKLAHEAVRSGDIFWNWYTDLGVNFIGSYSFYLLMSPFFWLTFIFPTSFVPFLMAPLLVLKFACISLTGYAFISRFVKNQYFAVVGGLLYAFSGFGIYNIFFNHFHEVMVFFPLLLIALEEFVLHDRRGVFALAVAANALINYWFFIGEVVFTVLYFFVRMTSPSFRVSLKRFFWLFFEAVLGMGLALFIFLPSVLAIMGNPRTGADSLLSGWNLWLYSHPQRYPGIIQALFFPPDLPPAPNFFPDHGGKWSSLSAWLPLFSMSGVLAYVLSVKKSWLKKILCISLVMALVPGLNALFILLNNSYYARWFYMPVLLMALASAKALDNPAIDFMRGVKWTGVIMLLIAVPVALTPQKVDDQWRIGLYKYIPEFWAYILMAAVCFVLCYLLMRHYRKDPRFVAFALSGVMVVSSCFGIIYLGMGRFNSGSNEAIIEKSLKGRYQLQMPDDVFYRTDVYEGLSNQGMFWHLPNIQAFHSIVPVSLMKFYPEVGVKRDVSSKPDAALYALRGLLSVKYLFSEQGKEEEPNMPGFVKSDMQLGFDIYENKAFVPMGFAYEHYIDEETFETCTENKRSNLLMRALLLTDEQIEKYGDLLSPLPGHNLSGLGTQDYLSDCKDRQSMSCVSFEKDNRGFTAVSNLQKENLVFFSVPYDEGWSATVNGEPVEIEKVDIGFMAVRVPAGECDIRFNYMTPGLLPGLCVSIGSAAVLVLYLLLVRRRRVRQSAAALSAPRPGEIPAIDIYDEEVLRSPDNLDAPDASAQDASPEGGASPAETTRDTGAQGGGTRDDGSQADGPKGTGSQDAGTKDTSARADDPQDGGPAQEER
ncbi:YfhO family protein [Zongyangia hominis]|uniref:YfhO family protein n=1 Tax=Zongyangia hominis TaxID=2763677 RepID=A0A926EB29_9FIRM|nr:YfhO family protein [Zongyangia hominis]MBC8570523.1 YfhO family protein [Zongyangia hominis]